MRDLGVERDWSAVRASKEAYWRALDPVDRLRLGDELRQAVLLLHPDWPTAEHRAADYDAHVRFLERLERASSTRQR